jgi:rhamnosyltransferase subunit B
MSRIVLGTFGSLGDLHPVIAVGRELAARGHEPVVATSALYAARVEHEGLGFHPVRPDLRPLEEPELHRRMMEHGRGARVLLDEVLFPALRESYDDLSNAVRGADLLVTGEILFAGPLVAEKMGIAWSSFVLLPIAFFSDYDPPVLGPFTRFSRVRRALGPPVNRPLHALVRRISRRWARPIAEFRRELGLPPGAHPFFEGKNSPELVLAMFSRVFAEPQPDWPPNVRRTGFAFHDRPAGEPELTHEAEDFLARGEPPVVFTLGSAAARAAGRFFVESLAAARRLGVRAILVLGPDPPERPAAPDRETLVLDYAPYSALFPRAAAVVHQGGIGTLAQVLRAARPMLVVPFAHDQFDNAARVERQGCGRVVPRSRYSVRRAAKELGRLLADPRPARRVEEVARIIRAEDGARAACDAIEERLGQGVARDGRLP